MSTYSSTRFSLYITLFIFWLGHLCVDVMIGIWPVYKSLANLDLTKAGFIVAVGAFIGEGSQILFGSLSDRGYRKIVATFGLLAVMSGAFIAYSTDYFVLFLLYMTVCIGSGAFHPSAAGFVNTILPMRKGLLMAIFASGGSLGLAFSQLIFTYFYEFWNGQTFIMVVPLIVLILGLILTVRSQPRVELSHAFRLYDFVTFLKQPNLRFLYISQVANQALFWGTIFILPDVLKALGHHDWVCFGGGHLCLILGAACMVIPAGYLADRYSARQVLLYASYVACTAFYFVIFFGNMSITPVLFALFVMGASLGIANPISVSLGVRFVPNKPSTISAFLMGMVWCLSEAIGPGGVGLMTSFFDNYAPVKALAILGGFFLLNIYTILRLPQEAHPVLLEELA